jgi:thiol-disulfide isomerase/thioredoxin
MKKVLYFTMKSCGPCKSIGPKVVELCRIYDVPLEIIQLDLPEGKAIGDYFRVVMTPEVVIADNLKDNSKPLDQNPGAIIANIPASELPHGLEAYLKPVGHPNDPDGEPLNNAPKKENYALIKGIIGLYCIKKIFF